MRGFLVLCLIILTVVDGAPPTAEILLQEFENDGNNYKFRYETSDGQKREETGNLVTSGNEEILKVVGSYSYIGADGRMYVVTYTADDNGYQQKSQSGPPLGPPAQAPIPSAAIASLNGGGIG